MADLMNVLFIMTDQQRADSIGPARHACANYPVMEHLAGESVTFSQFYTAATPCVPSRHSFLTGRHPWMLRCFANMRFSMGDGTTWMSFLRDQGYVCVSVGKTHLIHAGSYHIQVPAARSFGDQGGWDFFRPEETPESDEAYFDIHATRRACEALQRLKKAQPFAMFLGFHAPHEPYVMPRRYLDFLRPEDVPLPQARRADEYRTKSAAYRARVDRLARVIGPMTDDAIRRGIAGHHCLLKMVDDCLEQLFDTLRRLDLLDNTLIIFSSDHGDLLGDHGIFGKAATFYESEVHIPMMIRFPDGRYTGKRVPHLASSLDFVPTLLDILDVHPDVSFPGLSLVPMIEQGQPLRHVVTCATHRAMMVRTETDKLWYDYQDRDGEMYDLAQDPLELDNLYQSTKASEMRQQLFELMLHIRMESDAVDAMPTRREVRLHREAWSSYEPEVV